jgi:hypothetical protein
VLGRWLSDLEVGDVLGPVDLRLTPFLVREYSHSVEETSELHAGGAPLWAAPTIVQCCKGRLFDHACPAGPGPQARVHVVYDCTHHRMIPADCELSVTGEMTEGYERKGRHYAVLEIELRDKSTSELYVTYRDTSVLSFRATD